MLRTEAIRAHRDCCTLVLDYDNSLDRYDFETIARPAELPPFESPAVSITLKELASRFASQVKPRRSMGVKNQMEKSDHIALLSEILGENADVQTISSNDAQRVKDANFFATQRIERRTPLTRTLALNGSAGIAC